MIKDERGFLQVKYVKTMRELMTIVLGSSACFLSSFSENGYQNLVSHLYVGFLI